MADPDKTEEATPRKKGKLYEDGNIPKSADAGTAAILLCVVLALTFMGGTLVTKVVALSSRMFRLDDFEDPHKALVQVLSCLSLAGVPVFVAMFASFAAGFGQTRSFTLKPLTPKFDRLNPIPNFKKVLPGKETLLELSKQIVKLGAVGTVVYFVVVGATPQLSVLPAIELTAAAGIVGGVVRRLTIHAGLAFILVAVFDYVLAVRKFNEDAKMSKDEIKDERKQEDVSPEVKQQLKRRMMEAAMGGPAAVQEATVVVTNPTHFAVALRYVPEKDEAPVILAKGVDDVALQIRSQARHHEVPILENRPLARALFAEGKVGEPIPLDFYRAVAEIIGFVMQLKAGRTEPSGSVQP